jgi:DNA-binding HxlR family transcriptional regulator
MFRLRGLLEILQAANGAEPKSFNDFTKILVNKKRLSSAKISKRLDKLVYIRAIEQVIVKSKTGRRIIAYRTTEKGKKVVRLSTEIEKVLDD